MTNVPAFDFDRRKDAVRERDQYQCQNCLAEGPDTTLDVHHIVPRGKAGSNRISNLITLCRQCHDAIHRDEMAPRIKFRNGVMDEEEFDLWLDWWHCPPIKQVAIYDEMEQTWCIPRADFEQLLDALSQDELVAAHAS